MKKEELSNKNKPQEKREIIDGLAGWKEFRAKQEYEAGFRFFCKQLWEDLNKNIWGKLIILTGVIFLIGNTIFVITEVEGTIKLIFIIFFWALFCFFSMMYTAKVLDSETKDLAEDKPLGVRFFRAGNSFVRVFTLKGSLTAERYSRAARAFVAAPDSRTVIFWEDGDTKSVSLNDLPAEVKEAALRK